MKTCKIYHFLIDFSPIFFTQQYESGELLTGYLKKELIDVLQKLVGDHQSRRANVTMDVVKQYMTPRPLNFKMSQ